MLEAGIPAGGTDSAPGRAGAVWDQHHQTGNWGQIELTASEHIPEIHHKESEHLQRAVHYLPT